MHTNKIAEAVGKIITAASLIELRDAKRFAERTGASGLASMLEAEISRRLKP